MQEAQAREILNIEPSADICLKTIEEVSLLDVHRDCNSFSRNAHFALQQRYQKYFAANDPDQGGSFYLQSKIYRAKEAMEYAHEENLKAAQEQQQGKKEDEA